MVDSYSTDVAPYAMNAYSIFEDHISDEDTYAYRNTVSFKVFSIAEFSEHMLVTLNWLEDNAGEEVGVVAVLSHYGHIFSSLEDFSQRSESGFHIIDSKGHIIHTTDEEALNRVYDNEILITNIKEKAESGSIRSLENKDIIVSFSQYEDIDWIIVETTPLSVLSDSYDEEMNRVILISGVVSILLIILVIVLSTFMLKGLKDLLENIKLVKSGELEITSKPSVIMEVDDINTNFVRMTTRISTLMDDIQVANKKEKEAEFLALQAQINPHFFVQHTGCSVLDE